MLDVTPFIQAKSDQLNADDLIGGPITVQITGARPGSREQPVELRISGGHMPWRPCKTALRVMVAGWHTTDASQWVGRWVTLYRDPEVKWAGNAVGGVRISAMSHIEKPLNLTLAESKRHKNAHKVAVLPADNNPQGAPTADLAAFLDEAGLDEAAVDRWLKSNGKPVLADVPADGKARLAAMLAANPKRVEEIRSTAQQSEPEPAPIEQPEPAPVDAEAEVVQQQAQPTRAEQILADIERLEASKGPAAVAAARIAVNLSDRADLSLQPDRTLRAYRGSLRAS